MPANNKDSDGGSSSDDEEDTCRAKTSSTQKKSLLIPIDEDEVLSSSSDESELRWQSKVDCDFEVPASSNESSGTERTPKKKNEQKNSTIKKKIQFQFPNRRSASKSTKGCATKQQPPLVNSCFVTRTRSPKDITPSARARKLVSPAAMMPVGKLVFTVN